MADERLSFDLLANADNAVGGFVKAGRAASAAADDVMGLGRRLDEIGKKSATARVGLAGNTEAMAQLDKLDLKMLTVGRRVTDPKISLDGAAKASVEISLLDAQIDHLGRKSADVSVRGGGLNLLQNAVMGVTSSFGGGGGGGAGGLIAAVGLATPVITALGTVALGAATGLGAFGAMALPTFLKVGDALGKIKTDQQAVTDAVTKASKSTALAHLRNDWSNLSPPIAGAVKGIQGIEAEYGKFAKMLQPAALQLLSIGLKTATQFMAPLAGIALAVTPYIERLAKMIGGTLFKALMIIQPTIGPAFEAFIPLLGSISNLFLVLLKDLADHMQAWVNLSNAITRLIIASGPLITFLVNVIALTAELYTRAIPKLLDGLHSFASAFDHVRHDIAGWVKDIEMFFLNMILNVLSNVRDFTGALGHLPGPFGAPFRAASKAIDDERGKIALLKADLLGVHSKSININVGATGSWNVGPGGPGHHVGAAGMLVSGGTPGRDSVPILAMPGEVLVPVPMVAAGAVDHLRGRIPGFAAGGVVGSYRDGTGGLGGWVTREDSATLRALENATASGFSKALSMTGGFGIAGPGGGNPAMNATLAQLMFGNVMKPGDFAAWNYVAMRESGWSQFARNPSSGAYGIPQALPPSKMGAAANPPQSNPAAQISWMWQYMQSVYGGPKGAAAHEMAFNWYDRGGFLPPGVSIAVNGTGKPEPVGAARGGNTYHIHNHVAPNANLAEVGRVTVEAILKFEKGSGKGWRS